MAKQPRKKAGTKKKGSTKAIASVTPIALVTKSVTFSNSGPNTVVRIDVGGEKIVAGTKKANFAPGPYDLFYTAAGAGAFNVTVTGATLNAPIAGQAPGDGVLVMTVAP